jgi:DNA mismatch repair protein MutS2
MDSRTLRLLELDKILSRLSEHCACSLGQRWANGLRPATDFEEVTARQSETSEARRFWDGGGNAPFGGITDVRDLLVRASAGGVLETSELMEVAAFLYGSRHLKDALLRTPPGAYPTLLRGAAQIVTLRQVEDAIHAAIDERGEIRDNASEKLAKIRREIRSTTDAVHARLRSLLADSDVQNYLQEAIITLRDDRYCVPVKAEHRARLGGIVHDRSASGATFFVEPAAIVDLNNELRRLKLDERDEIFHIRQRLSNLIGERSTELLSSLDAIGRLDFIFAKAKLSRAMNAMPPQLNAEGKVDLKQARHPLLTGDVVPIDVQLGMDFNTLLITGPNTGGKTVTLKTVGLLTLMAQCGLHVPAEEGSQLAVFKQIFADIGDEQSIEQSLSTFSSHMKQIVKILRRADEQTLVLLDEIGAGTDPDEGAALAKAVLTALRERNAKTICTTHYGELKRFAYNCEGMRNASVEFDAKTLRPTYRLRIGLPGRSNAFAIAARLGMPWKLVRKARGFLRRDRAQAEEIIRRMEESQRTLEHEATVAEREREQIEQLRESLEQQVEKLRADRESTLEEAREQARQLLRRVREEADAILRQLRAAPRESKETEQARQRLRELKREVDIFAATQTDEEESSLISHPSSLPEGVTLGDIVYVESLRRTGVLLTQPDSEGRVKVRVGAMAVEVETREVKPAPQAAPPVNAAALSAMRFSKAFSVDPEIHLRGLTVEESLARLDKYLDDATIGEVSPVRIVHGKGTGALREAIHAYLRKHPSVASFHVAELSDGGDGVTVAHLNVEQQ